MNKVLVIDDSVLVGKVVALYLGRYGWEVESMSSLFGVLAKIREYGPDIILLDLKMPGLSGSKLASVIRGHNDLHGFKIISFSTEDAPVQEALVKSGLVDAYFVKSRNLDGLAETIEHVVKTERTAA